MAGSSGSGKTSLALAIIAKLNLPWVVIMSMVCFETIKSVTCPLLTKSVGLVLQASYPRAV